MKPLRPSMKENKRYLLVDGEDLRSNIEKAILSFIGTLGLSKTALEFIKSNKNSAIISINREAVNAVRASFAVFPKKIEVKMVSGTLKGLRDKIK
jgi:RNase P/RNase MRP subunit POP5